MELPEEYEVNNTTVQVLRSELERLSSVELGLKSELEGAQVLIAENMARKQQQRDSRADFVQSLTEQAEEHSRQCAKSRAQVIAFQDIIRRAEQEESTETTKLDALRAQEVKYREKNEKYRTRSFRLQKETEPISAALVQHQTQHQSLGRLPLSYKVALRGYPRVIRPRFKDLVPVGKLGETLEDILYYDAATTHFSSHSYYLPYTVEWCGPHAVLFTPTSAFNPITMTWGPFSIPRAEDGKIYHLFLRRGLKIFYWGSYRLRRLQNHVFSDLDNGHLNRHLSQILEIATPRSTPAEILRTFEQLVMDDVVPLECITFECTGFSHELYGRLAQRLSGRKGQLVSPHLGIMNANHGQEDAQATREIAKLLGRELVSAKRRIKNLENQLQESKVLLNQPGGKQNYRTSEPVLQLQQEIEGYKQEQYRLIQQVSSLRSQARDAKKQIKEMSKLRKQFKSLENQRDKAREEAKKSKALYKDLKQHRNKLNANTDDASESNPEGNGPFSIMSALPPSPTRPRQGSLLPVIEGSFNPTKLCAYLMANLNTRRYTENSIIFPGRFSWCASPGGYHHALAFEPTHVFNIQTRSWEKGLLMESLYGMVRELFYVQKGKTYYAGTYKCIRFENSSIRLPDSEIEGLTSIAIAEAALSDEFSNAPSSVTHRGTLSKLYREGVLMVECMGLQCVGFNKQLYKELLAQYASNPAPKKRRRSLTVTGGATKKKRRLSVE
ncbi:hypothetical protein D9756_011060 [Leucocoprinus leucothites]|uniref:Uncharacterized protein n=1 Tax=Leucocoprinus leucothites TaxID=201217 RepID=A0A8H5CN11_9AGAR|nr:hypothetical protein D9756_011060 [Leucoagaricus leucothites]